MSLDKRGKVDDDHHENHRPPIMRTQRFNKSLLALGSQDRARVTANLEEFEKDWSSGVTTEELYARWNYKSLKVPAACKQHDLRQIKPTNSTRAWMARDSRGHSTMLLFVILKTSSQVQQRTIKKLCEHLSARKA